VTPLEEWDSHWIKVYDHAVSKGKTPNQAVVVADANTEGSLGPRPVEVVS
jgi:hypothetical protein